MEVTADFKTSKYGYEDVIPTLVEGYLANSGILPYLCLYTVDDTYKFFRESFNWQATADNCCVRASDTDTGDTFVVMCININQDTLMHEMQEIGIDMTPENKYECIRYVVAHECGHVESLYRNSVPQVRDSHRYAINETLCAILIEDYIAEKYAWTVDYSEFRWNYLNLSTEYIEGGGNCSDMGKLFNRLSLLAYESAVLGNPCTLDHIVETYPDKQYDSYVYTEINRVFSHIVTKKSYASRLRMF